VPLNDSPSQRFSGCALLGSDRSWRLVISYLKKAAVFSPETLLSNKLHVVPYQKTEPVYDHLTNKKLNIKWTARKLYWSLKLGTLDLV